MSMASNDTDETRNSDGSSDDECLSEVKRKVDLARSRSGDDSDYEPIISEIMVSIEVDEYDEEPLDFSIKKEDKPATSKRRRNDKCRKSKEKKPKVYGCNLCSAQYKNAQELRAHSLEHQVKTRHKCDECGRYFKKAFSLRLHQKIHTTMEFDCRLCDMKFTSKGHLFRHLRSHEKTEHCDVCPAKYHSRIQLNRHRRLHTLHGMRTQTADETARDTTNKSDQLIPSAPDIEYQNTSCPTEYSEDSTDLNSEAKNLNCTRKEDLPENIQCAIVSKLYKGRTVTDICQIYNLTPDVVNEVWEERDTFSALKKAGRRSKMYMNSILDARILDWYRDQKSNKVQVSGKMLQDIAELFAKENGFIAFDGSRKWLDGFKKKYSISLRGVPVKREFSIGPESKWKKTFFKEQWCDARLGVKDEDIYTADEVGIYYNPSKGRVKKPAGKKFIQGYVEDRLAIFMCVNATGTDRKKLLVCGSDDPLLHSYRDADTLPVTYIRHANAHFTTQMFEGFVKYWNKELQMNNRRAILVLDRATVHTKLQLSNLKLVFVPWKAYNGLIPVRNGIFNRFKDEFRRLFITEKAMNVVRGVDRRTTSLEALYMIMKAWERTPNCAISRSFVNLGFDVQEPKIEENLTPKVCENDEEIMCKLLRDYDVDTYYTELPSLDNFLNVDEELLTGQGTNCSVFGGNHKIQDPAAVEREREEILAIGTKKPECSEIEERVTKIRALQDLDIVRKYLQTSNTSYDVYKKFMDIEKYVLREPMKL
ncbi:tigger transposable element-derived protein 4-like [Bombyx mandarina]|uniref:Tigger transposable element-derived protein 4-like n=1 Tax=Bombyx mandarina TaxID=7092 RepID=A0A6J2JPR6_BOMMA|nr:tigger transposable element-derived protein 4-like [Bombyx mandarina]